MRSAYTIILLLVLGLCLSCGGEVDTPPSETRPHVPDPNVVRMNGGCTDQRFLDAEWAAYQALLREREEAAHVLKKKIDEIEVEYNERKRKLNSDYVRALNQCANNTSCSEKAKTDYDTYIERAQVVHDDGIYVAQGNELAAKEQAQQEYEAAVKEAREKYCKRSYRATGGTAKLVFSGVVCSLEQPFTIMGQSMLSYTLNFTPTSGTAGSFAYTASGQGVSATGKGAYTVEGADTENPKIVIPPSSVTGTAGGRTVTTTAIPASIDLIPLETNECS